MIRRCSFFCIAFSLCRRWERLHKIAFGDFCECIALASRISFGNGAACTDFRFCKEQNKKTTSFEVVLIFYFSLAAGHSFFCREKRIKNALLFHLEGAGVELIILATFIDKSLMVALFDNFTLFKNNDILGVSYC